MQICDKKKGRKIRNMSNLSGIVPCEQRGILVNMFTDIFRIPWGNSTWDVKYHLLLNGLIFSTPIHNSCVFYYKSFIMSYILVFKFSFCKNFFCDSWKIYWSSCQGTQVFSNFKNFLISTPSSYNLWPSTLHRNAILISTNNFLYRPKLFITWHYTKMCSS